MNHEKIGILKDLSTLLDEGKITHAEFEAQKRLLLRPGGCLAGFGLASRILTPQIVILILVLLFYGPMRNLVSNASEVGFGDVFAVKVQQALRVGNPDLAEVLKTLSTEEIITLLDSGEGAYSLIYSDKERQELSLNLRYNHYLSLQEKGLVDAEDDLKAIKNIFDSKPSSREPLIRDSVLGSFKQKHYPINAFSTEEIEKLENVSASLSVSGEQVYQLIVGIASEELSSLK